MAKDQFFSFRANGPLSGPLAGGVSSAGMEAQRAVEVTRYARHLNVWALPFQAAFARFEIGEQPVVGPTQAKANW